MASGQPAVQTLVLRVSIHCHGCKKKVRKVLKSIQGVQDVEVDAQQHKVLVTGTVDADTLLKRLYKSGKQALPWQHEPAGAAPAKMPEAPPPATPAEDAGAAAVKKPADPVKEPQADDGSDKTPEQEETAPDQEKTPETEKEAGSEKEKEEGKPEPGDGAKKDAVEGAATDEPKAEDRKEAGNDEGEAKKKQSKPDDAPAADRSISPATAPAHAHQEFNPLLYNASQPVMSVSYYAPQPEQGYSAVTPQQAQPMKQWSPSYLYTPYPHASPESYYQDHYSPPGTHAPPPPPPPLQDSYRLFDDENPNSCSVM